MLAYAKQPEQRNKAADMKVVRRIQCVARGDRNRNEDWCRPNNMLPIVQVSTATMTGVSYQEEIKKSPPQMRNLKKIQESGPKYRPISMWLDNIDNHLKGKRYL